MTRRHHFEWTESKARWYWRAVKHNDYPLELLHVILPLLKDCNSVLDVGAGCGAFTLPLAHVVPTVTALEPASPMATLLHNEVAQLGLTNVHLLEADFREAEVAPHDTILCAFVPNLDDLDIFLPWVERVGKRRVILIRRSRTGEDKFFLNELNSMLLGKTYRERRDYLDTVVSLHERGIFANVQMVDFRIDQPFDDLEEAVAFSREYLGLKDERHNEALRTFLQERLVAVYGVLSAPVRHTSAVLWLDLS